ncbi:MAG: putative toxin-antitoxin system toxin component, PIN family [candidate division Zixibacteria bacterium]|nr:putative toxin-antitoxin system toxin component, PIN family [candidate division Zixibacteria bacterium]
MKIVVDTNVFVSGVFFRGAPYQILEAWRDGKVDLVISREILEEYQRVGEELGNQFPGIDFGRILDFLTVKAELIEAPNLPESVCVDSEDDKFLACALASESRVIISGDKHLLEMSGYRGVNVVRPRKFLDDLLNQ